MACHLASTSSPFSRALHLAFCSLVVSAPTFAAETSSPLPVAPNSSVTQAPQSSSATNASEAALIGTAWRIDMEALHSQDALSQQRSQFTTSLLFSADFRLAPWLTANLAPRVLAQTGYIQTPDALNPEVSRIEIHNASLQAQPWQILKISLGSLNERDGKLHDPIFMRDISFPALRATLESTSSTRWQALAFVESAIPTSTSLSNNSDDLNSTPTLNTAGLGFHFKSQQSQFESLNRVNYFQFQNLPQTVQTASAILGNTAIATVGADYLLTSKYQGLEVLSRNDWRLSAKWDGKLWLAGLQNTSAQSGRGLGYRIGSSLGYKMNKDWEVAPEYTFFDIQPDATVATYNALDYNTNRVGYQAGLSFTLKAQYEMFVGYEPRVAVIENPSQPDENFFLMKLRIDSLPF